MVKIGNVEIHGPLTLAPMAGVTDAPFRALCRAQGAALTCTEMVSAKALVYHDEKTKQLLEPIREAIANGLPVFGTCAGMILLANSVENEERERLATSTCII